MTSPAHEEMVEAVALLIDAQGRPAFREDARKIVALIFERLKVVTPQMGAAGARAPMRNGDPLWVFLADNGKDIRDIAPAFLAMLAASPLTPGDGE